MKFIKLCSLFMLAAPTLIGCGETNYDVTVILDRSSSQVYDNGTQEITFSIQENTVKDYNLSFVENVDASYIVSNSCLGGKTLTFDRVTETQLKVTFAGDSTYDFGQDTSANFNFKFLDKVFNKSGFHDYGNELSIVRSHGIITSLVSGPHSHIVLQLVGTTFVDYQSITIDSIVADRLEVFNINAYSDYHLSFSYKNSEDDATVKFPKQLFHLNKELVIIVDHIFIGQSLLFS